MDSFACIRYEPNVERPSKLTHQYQDQQSRFIYSAQLVRGVYAHPEVAKDIINEVVSAVKDWRTLANKLGITKREMSLFEGVFDNRVINVK